jgi:hypothetical protein
VPGVALTTNEVVVAEYGSRFEADVALACLTDNGIEGVLRADPAHAVAPHLVTMPGYRVAVHRDDVELALVALGADEPLDPQVDELDRDYLRVPFAHRPRWMRWLTFAALAGVAGPLAITAVALAVTVLLRLAPG